MSNENNQLVSEYVYLAEASYADFSGIDYTKVEIIKTQIRNAGGIDKKPAKFAELVTNNYSVEAHYTDRTNESSFSGTLFKNKDTGKYVLALKGTQEYVKDGLADLDIINDGLAHKQIIDMYNFWQQINANNGQSYQVATTKVDNDFTEQLKNLLLNLAISVTNSNLLDLLGLDNQDYFISFQSSALECISLNYMFLS